MKGYCVDVRGFSAKKKKLVVKAIGELTGLPYRLSESAEIVADKITNIGPSRGAYLVRVICGYGELTDMQAPHKISFNDLMLEAGFNYEDNGVECFKLIDLPECAVTENKSPSNKTRPLITREQYDAVMAQSDKRTFTKALDDLLAIEKEQLLDESAIMINRLERENQELAKARFADRVIVDPLRRENKRLERKLEESKRGWIVSCLISISTIAVIVAYDFLK